MGEVGEERGLGGSSKTTRSRQQMNATGPAAMQFQYAE